MLKSDFFIKTISGDSVDNLVKGGIEYIEAAGHNIQTHSGSATQAGNVCYVLENARRRVHTLRAPIATQYLARELYAYFIGSLDVADLAYASSYWEKLADKNHRINSNYGYYIFHQTTPGSRTQLDWVRDCFKENLGTRKAVININNINHKINTKDFPCTLGLTFHLNNGLMNCDVSSRSTDVLTGLPYDMAFFSFVNELVSELVAKDTNTYIKTGYTAMHATFTQIYDKTKDKIKIVKMSNIDSGNQIMPEITDAEQTLDDIYQLKTSKPKSQIISWVIKNMKGQNGKNI